MWWWWWWWRRREEEGIWAAEKRRSSLPRGVGRWTPFSRFDGVMWVVGWRNRVLAGWLAG